MNRDKYDGLHFLFIICLAFIQIELGFNDWIFGLLLTLYAAFAIMVIEGLTKYSITKFLILLPLVIMLKVFMTVHS